MAFKILDEDTLNLLTDKQKKQYEKELDLYNKRIAYVAQLEKYESVELKPFQPKLKPVAVISQTEFKEYIKQEFKAQLPKPVSTPELQLDFVEIKRPVSIDLPGVSVQVIDTKPFTIEKNQPVLPIVTQPVAANIKITISEAAPPDLPVFMKPEVVAAVFKRPERSMKELPLVEKPIVNSSPLIKSMDFNTKERASRIPRVIVPNVAVPAFTKPENAVTSLPSVSVTGPSVKNFSKPQSPAVKNLPSVSVTGPSVKNFSKPQSPAVNNLPSVSVTGPSLKSFIKPQQKDIGLPNVSVTKIKIKPILIDKAAPKLPENQSVLKVGKTYSQPAVSMSSLPDVAKPNIAVVSFQKPEIGGLDLPSTVVSPSVPHRLKPVKATKTDVVAPQIKKIAVNAFKKQEYKVAGIPKHGSIIVPDARAALGKYFPVTN